MDLVQIYRRHLRKKLNETTVNTLCKKFKLLIREQKFTVGAYQMPFFIMEKVKYINLLNKKVKTPVEKQSKSKWPLETLNDSEKKVVVDRGSIQDTALGILARKGAGESF